MGQCVQVMVNVTVTIIAVVKLGTLGMTVKCLDAMELIPQMKRFAADMEPAQHMIIVNVLQTTLEMNAKLQGVLEY